MVSVSKGKCVTLSPLKPILQWTLGALVSFLYSGVFCLLGFEKAAFRLTAVERGVSP